MNMTTKTRFNTAFILFLLLTLITGSVLIALLTKTLPLLTAKALYFCQQFISTTFFQLPNLLPNTIIFALVPVLILGILSFLIQLFKTYNLQRNFLKKRIKLTKRVEQLVSATGLGGRVYFIKDPNLFSFCSGIFHQRIILTTGLAEALTDSELDAVLLHEQAHLKNLDPIKVLLGKTVSSMFFFLPIFSELNKNMVASSEILADNWVIRTQSGSNFLRSAIRKIIAMPQVSFATVPNIASDNLEIRIHRLVNPTFEHKFHLSPVSILTSILFVLLSWFLLQTPVNAFHTETSHETSYFLCSADNACRQECNHNAQTSKVSSPDELFTKDVNFNSSPNQTLKYQSSYK